MSLPYDTVLLYLLVYIRALAFLLAAPFFSWKVLPLQIRSGLALVLTIAIAPALPLTVIPETMAGLVLSCVQAMFWGVSMGLAMRIVLAALETAGHLIGVEMGLAMPAGMDPSRERQANAPSQWLSTMAMLLFFCTGFYQEVLIAFIRSFHLHPPGNTLFGVFSIGWLAAAGSLLFEIGLAMAAPIIAVNFLVNLSFAILGKVVPRMNVFVTSFPVRIMAGFSILAGATGLFSEFIFDLFRQSIDTAMQALY
jgi:flagellar biosynthetic protein FliR